MSTGVGQGYSGPVRAIHWAPVVLLLGTCDPAGTIKDAPTTARAAWRAMRRRSCDLGVLGLAWWLGTPVRSLPAGPRAPQRLAARAGTIARYALPGPQPLFGLAVSLPHGDQVTWCGRFARPAVLPVDRARALRIFAVHGWTVLLLLALIAVNMAAAMHHHVIRRDRVLAGMVPRRSPSPVRPDEARLPR